MAKVHTRTFEWGFDAPPGALWPALGDTARFNEAAGGDIIVSQTLADDPVAAPLLAPYAMTTEERSIKGFAEPVTYHRLSAAALAS